MEIKGTATETGLQFLKDNVKENVKGYCFLGSLSKDDAELDEILTKDNLDYGAIEPFIIKSGSTYAIYYDELGQLTFEIEIPYETDDNKYIYSIMLLGENNLILAYGKTPKILKIAGVGGTFIYKVNVLGTQGEVVYIEGDYASHALVKSLDNVLLDNIETHKNDNSNPHIVTKAQVGLSDVDNTSDLAKPISVAVQNALNTKQPNGDYVLNSSLNAHIADKSNPHGVTKAQIGLGNVDNTTDLAKPISTATQNALNDKQPKGEYAANNHGHGNIIFSGGKWWEYNNFTGFKIFHYEIADTVANKLPVGSCEVWVSSLGRNRGSALCIEWASSSRRTWIATLHDDSGSNNWSAWREIAFNDSNILAVPTNATWRRLEAGIYMPDYSRCNQGQTTFLGCEWYHEGCCCGYSDYECWFIAQDPNNGPFIAQTGTDCKTPLGGTWSVVHRDACGVYAGGTHISNFNDTDAFCWRIA